MLEDPTFVGMLQQRFFFPIIANTGDGKSVLERAITAFFSEEHSDTTHHTWSNMPMEGEREYTYTPCLLIPDSLLEKYEWNLIVVDDVKSIKLPGLIERACNLGRKLNCSILISGQRHTFVTPTIRELCTAYIRVNYHDKKDYLGIKLYFGVLDIPVGGIPSRYDWDMLVKWKHISKYFSLYNTKDRVVPTTDSEIEKALMEYSTTYKELENNVGVLFNADTKRRYWLNLLRSRFPDAPTEIPKKARKKAKKLPSPPKHWDV